jgi:hypothetical protein
MQSTEVSSLDPSLYMIVNFFRRYPHGINISNGFIRLMGNKFDSDQDEHPSLSAPISWDLEPIKEETYQYRQTFDPPLDEEHFCAHLQECIISVPQKAVALVGAYSKATEMNGQLFLPNSYDQAFISIRELNSTAGLLWQWHGETPAFGSSNLVVSFAFSPAPGSGLFVFSTRAGLMDGDGLYVGSCVGNGIRDKPRRISSMTLSIRLLSFAYSPVWLTSDNRTLFEPSSFQRHRRPHFRNHCEM